MGRHIILSLLLTAIAGLAYAQTVVLADGERALCSGRLVDPGAQLPYLANQRITATLCPEQAGTQLSLTFGWSDITRGDRLCIFDGRDTLAPELTCSNRWTGGRQAVQASAENSSGCLTLRWRTDDSGQGRGFSADIACSPICQPIEPYLDQAMTPELDADGSTLDLCPGSFVSLYPRARFPQNNVAYQQSERELTYRWQLPDGQRIAADSLVYGFPEPGGYIIELTATDQQGCSTTSPLRVRTRVAAPPSIVGRASGQDTVCAPRAYELDLTSPDGALAVSTPVQFFAPLKSRTDSLPLPDGTGAAHESTIIVSEFEPGAVLERPEDLLGVCANMEHSWLRDLSIELVSPDGRSVVLHDHPCRCGDEAFLGEPIEGDGGTATPQPGLGYTYCWRANAARGSWLSYLADNPQTGTLPAGEYAPDEPLSGLVGAPLNGAWTLRILDHWEADNGWIYEWSLDFAKHLARTVDSFQTSIVTQTIVEDAAHSSNTGSAASYAATLPGGMSNEVLLYNDYGCRYDTTLYTTVLPEQSYECGPCVPTSDTLPVVTIAAGESVLLNLAALTQEGGAYAALGARRFSFATHPPTRPLRVKLPVLAPMEQDLTREGAEAMTVCVDLQTEELGDLAVRLASPSGQQVALLQNSSWRGPWDGPLCFRQQPETAADTLAPASSFNALIGEPLAGDWHLLVSDGFGFGDDGTLRRWHIQFNAITPPTLEVPTGITSGPNGEYRATPSTSTSYTFRYQDARGCDHAFTYPVVVEQPCDLTLERVAYKDPSCLQRPDGELLVTATGNQGPVTYMLGNVANRTGKFTDLYPADHLVRAIDSAACATQLATSLVAPPSADLIVVPNLEQCAPRSYSVVVGTTGEVGLREASWVDQPTQGLGTRRGLPPGDYSIQTLDERGCSVYHPVSLPAATSLTVESLTQPIGCGGDETGVVELVIEGGTPPYAVRWEDGSLLAKREDLPAGRYSGLVTDAEGCETSFAARLVAPSTLSAQLEVEPNWCYGEEAGAVAILVTSGEGPFECRADGGAWQPGTLVYGLAEGLHEVELRNAARCVWTSDVFVPTLSQLRDTIEIMTGTTAYAEPVDISAAPGKRGALTRLDWRYSGAADFGCDTCVATTITPYESGLLTVFAEDTLGCSAEGKAQLLIRRENEVFVPTGFAPDGSDPSNRHLRVHGRSGTVIERFVLFDRWGTQVYAAGPTRTNAAGGWDGTYRGKPAEAGVYLYEVTARDRSGALFRLRGNTTLLR